MGQNAIAPESAVLSGDLKEIDKTVEMDVIKERENMQQAHEAAEISRLE